LATLITPYENAVDAELRTLLSDLFVRGVAHDAAEPDRLRRLRNLEPATAELLTLVLRVAGAREIVEIGTSNGYSAIWLADAARDTGGRVTSVDVEQWPIAADPSFVAETVAVGKGLHLAWHGTK
jgi:predicted O-methyltransferase YrrM